MHDILHPFHSSPSFHVWFHSHTQTLHTENVKALLIQLKTDSSECKIKLPIVFLTDTEIHYSRKSTVDKKWNQQTTETLAGETTLK